ncbi:16S rRNA (uracil(1498)-N(3))-methyltransferase [bacterium]|nr:16S rRNA (uracil(1498)-N(3))-methyltransferase [bacterium]
MNLVILKTDDFIDHNIVRLKERRFKHLSQINRVKKNQKISCGLLNGKTGPGIIIAISNSFIEIKVDLKNSPPEPLPLTLVLSLPRPKMLKRIIESVTSLGVKKIYLINSWRVEKSYWQSPLLDQNSLEKYMILGLEQSCDTILPKIHQKKLFTPFVKEELPLISEGNVCITAHPGVKKKCPAGVNKNIVLVIGPEGGLIDKEVKTLENIGFTTYNIGNRILRVETAVTYLISRLSL